MSKLRCDGKVKGQNDGDEGRWEEMEKVTGGRQSGKQKPNNVEGAKKM